MEISAETATWVAAGVAAAALIALVLFVLVMVARRRSAQDVAEATVEELRRYLEEAVAGRSDPSPQLRQPDARLRRLSEVTQTVDLDEVLERTLRAAVELSGAAAALVAVDADGGRVVRTLGLSDDELGRQLGIPPAAADARGLEVEYRYTDAEAASDEFRLRRGLAVPLRSRRGGTVGTINVFWRRGARPITDEDISFLEEVGTFLAPALENARLLGEARAAAWTDESTRLPNRRYFEDALHREYARARRHNHSLSVVVFDLGGHEPSRRGLAVAAERLLGAVRAGDLAARLADRELALLLPETPLAGAEAACRRVEPGVRAEIGTVAARLAELGPEEDPATLLARAESGAASEAA